MSKEYNEFQELMRRWKFIEAANYAEREYLYDKKQNVFWLTQQANALIRAEKYKLGFDISSQALTIDSTNPYAVLSAADALFGLNRFKEALQYYSENLNNQKLKLRSQRGILECLLTLKKWNDILSYLESWDMPEKDSIRYRVKALVGLGEYTGAAEACRKWLDLKPHNRSALWELTELEIRRDGIDDVLKRMEKLSRISSLPSIYGEIYASLCRRSGKQELAIKQYEKLEAEGSQHRIQRKQAFVLAKTGQEKEAVQIMEELLRVDPKDMYLHSSYGAACARIGELERAVNFYQKLLSSFPDEKSLYGRIQKLKNMLDKKQ